MNNGLVLSTIAIVCGILSVTFTLLPESPPEPFPADPHIPEIVAYDRGYEHGKTHGYMEAMETAEYEAEVKYHLEQLKTEGHLTP